MEFKNTVGEKFTLENVVKTINEAASFGKDTFNLYIGCDSQVHGRSITYVTAIVLSKNGKGSRIFYATEKIKITLDMSVRLFNEVTKSMEIIKEIEDSPLYKDIRDNMEVHIDVGNNGKSKNVMSAVIGYVRGMGYKYKVKPDSWCATHVADKFVR